MKRIARAYWILSTSLLALCGCDNTPNPDFEQKIKDARAERVGDPYAQLSNTPQQYRYARTDPPLRQAHAGQEALSLRSSYDLMLAKFDAAPKASGTEVLLTACRGAFADASAFQVQAASQPQAAALAAATEIFNRLTTCRDQVLATEKTADSLLEPMTSTLRRFASTGMVLVGVTTIARGDEAGGLDLWHRADALVAEDKPGFEVRPEMLLRQ